MSVIFRAAAFYCRWLHGKQSEQENLLNTRGHAVFLGEKGSFKH